MTTQLVGPDLPVRATGHGGDDLETALRAFPREHPEAGDLKRTDALTTLRDLAEILAAAGPAAPLVHWQNPHV